MLEKPRIYYSPAEITSGGRSIARLEDGEKLEGYLPDKSPVTLQGTLQGFNVKPAEITGQVKDYKNGDRLQLADGVIAQAVSVIPPNLAEQLQTGEINEEVLRKKLERLRKQDELFGQVEQNVVRYLTSHNYFNFRGNFDTKSLFQYFEFQDDISYQEGNTPVQRGDARDMSYLFQSIVRNLRMKSDKNERFPYGLTPQDVVSIFRQQVAHWDIGYKEPRRVGLTLDMVLGAIDRRFFTEYMHLRVLKDNKGVVHNLENMFDLHELTAHAIKIENTVNFQPVKGKMPDDFPY